MPLITRHFVDVICREMFVDAVRKLLSSLKMPFEAVPSARPMSPRSEPQLSRRPGFNDLSMIVCDLFSFGLYSTSSSTNQKHVSSCWWSAHWRPSARSASNSLTGSPPQLRLDNGLQSPTGCEAEHRGRIRPQYTTR